MSRIMPDLDAELPVLVDARRALGDRLSDETLEGYLAGRLALQLLGAAAPARTVDALHAVTDGKTIDLGGVKVDYRDPDSEGLHVTRITYLAEDGWRRMTQRQWRRWR